jgi:hypothetical protein
MEDIQPREWATFHLKIWLDPADYDCDEYGYFGHDDRLVLEYFEHPQDKIPVERYYFEFESSPYRDSPDATDAIKELLDTLEWDLAQAEV